MLNQIAEEAVRPISSFVNAIGYRPKEEEWATPNQVVLNHQTLKLRHFNGPKFEKTVFILPPMAANSSTLADFTDDQSLVRVFQNHGYNVFATDWQPATTEHRDMGISDYIRLTDMGVDRAMEISGSKKVLMVGQCQGGWQTAIYASLFPKKISGLIVAAAPIDLEAENSLIGNCIKIPNLQNIYKLTVGMHNGVMPGRLMLRSFKAIRPHEHYFWKFIKLWGMCVSQDEEGLKRHERFTNWYEKTQNLPGKFFLEVVEIIFRLNSLTKPNSYSIDGRGVDLRNIKCPLVLIGGAKDDITPPKQVFAMEKLVSSKKISKLLSSGGHIGTLMSTTSLKEIWPRAIDFFNSNKKYQKYH